MNASFRKYSLRLKGKLLHFEKPLVMAIMNVTPDSFYSQSASMQIQALVDRAGQLLNEGADILDIGGMSSRPGAEIITADEEMERVLPVIEQLKEKYPESLLSIDTLHATTAKGAVDKGVSLINDISGGSYDPEILDVAASEKVPFICMHMRGTPKTMKQLNQYDDMTRTLMMYFKERILSLRAKGISDIIIDPGFGFAKNIQQNFQLLNRLHLFQVFDLPVMIGISRKSFIYKTINGKPEDALNGTTVIHTLALQQGVQILRVHDPKEAKEAVTLMEKTYRNE